MISFVLFPQASKARLIEFQYIENGLLIVVKRKPNQVNQSKHEINTCSRSETRENVCERRLMIVFSFTSN